MYRRAGEGKRTYKSVGNGACMKAVADMGTWILKEDTMKVGAGFAMPAVVLVVRALVIATD